MASPKSRAIDTILIFFEASASSESGIELVTTTSSSGESWMRCTAGPLRTPCVAHGDDAFCPAFHHGAGGVAERARRVDEIVHDDAVATLHVADEVHHLAHVRAFATLVDDGERGAEPLRVRARAFDASGVGSDEHRLVAEARLQVVVEKDGQRVEMIEGNVEKALDLAGVEIGADDARNPRGHHADRQRASR